MSSKTLSKCMEIGKGRDRVIGEGVVDKYDVDAGCMGSGNAAYGVFDYQRCRPVKLKLCQTVQEDLRMRFGVLHIVGAYDTFEGASDAAARKRLLSRHPTGSCHHERPTAGGAQQL